MSVQALTWVLDHSPAEHADRLVLLSLANHAHADGTNAYPSVPTIAREARLSTRAVQYALRSLLADGFALSPDECRARGVPTGTLSGPAIADAGTRGPNGARVYTVLMDDRARAFRSSKRPTNGPKREAAQTLHPAAEGSGASDLAPPPVQPATPEGRNIASHGKEPSPDPSGNHPPAPASGGASPPARPAGKRRRDHERFRRELAAWEHDRSAAAPHADALPGDLAARWADARATLRASVDDATFEMWLDELHPHAVGAGRIVLAVCDRDRLGWIRDRFGRLLAGAVAGAFRAPLEVDVVACAADPSPSLERSTPC